MNYEHRKRDSMGRVSGEVESVTIRPPEALSLEGESGESTILWKRLPSGELEITAIDGVKYGGESEMNDRAEMVTEEESPEDAV